MNDSSQPSGLLRRACVLAILAGCSAAAPAVDTRPVLIPAPSDTSDVPALVASELAKAEAKRARLLVYVGASWCEPCRRFHDALGAGELDATLPNLRFLEFDYDRSKPALERAGYVSRLIPLFAIPNADGTASAQRMEGSIKGPSAVAQNLVPRLKELLRVR